MSEAVEQVELVKQVLTEMASPPGTKLKVVEKQAEKKFGTIFTGSGSLSDTVSKDASRCADKRFRIVVAMLRQMFTPAAMWPKWWNTKSVLAGGLTK